MAEHTPGPWGWEYHPDHHDNPVALSSHDGDVLLITGDDRESYGVARSEADLALIASAPDLFAACEATLAKLDYLRNLWGDEGVTRSLCDQVRAAVAKAKGGV